MTITLSKTHLKCLELRNKCIRMHYFDFHKAEIIWSVLHRITPLWVRYWEEARRGRDWRGLGRDLVVQPCLLLILHLFWGSPGASTSPFLVPSSGSLTWVHPPCFPGQHRTSHCLCQPGTLSLTALLLPSHLGVPCPCCSLHHLLDCLLPNTPWSPTKETTRLTCLGHSSISSLTRLTRGIITVSPSLAWVNSSHSSHSHTITTITSSSSSQEKAIPLCHELSSRLLHISQCQPTLLPLFPEPSRWLRFSQMRIGTCGRSWKDAMRRWRDCRRWDLHMGLFESFWNLICLILI